MRTVFIYEGAFFGDFRHQFEFELLQIPETTVDQFRRAARCPRGKILHVDKCRFQSSARRIEQNAGARDPSTDDEKIMPFFRQAIFHFLPVIRYKSGHPLTSFTEMGNEKRESESTAQISCILLRQKWPCLSRGFSNFDIMFDDFAFPTPDTPVIITVALTAEI